MSAAPFAPKTDDGLYAYVVSTQSWGKVHDTIEWAANLADAKAKFGWTRMRYTSVTVRRARLSDLASVPASLDGAS